MDTQYLKSVAKYAISVVLSMILIAYLLYHISGGFQENIETVSAELTTREETLTISTTIMRDETVLFSPINGDVSLYYSDGDKLPVNTKVADVYSSAASSDIRKRILQLDKKIRILENSNMSESGKRTDTASTDKLIWKELYSFLDNSANGNVSSALSESDALLALLNNRKIIVGSVSNYDEKIETLKKEKNELTEKLSQAESTVITDMAGYFYSAADGYENIFSSENISTLTYSVFSSKKEMQAEDYSGTDKGYPIGKLVTDYLWYIACEIDTELLHNYSTGGYYDVKFPHNGGVTINMYLFRILYEVGSDTAVLIFRTDIHPDGFNYLRNQTVQIVSKSYTGYRVPVSAVRMQDGVEGVYILQGSKVLFKRIETLFEYDGYLIVKEQDESASDSADWLAKNDFVIVKGKELYDGKILS